MESFRRDSLQHCLITVDDGELGMFWICEGCVGGTGRWSLMED